MIKQLGKFIAGGCSFTFGSELSDYKPGKEPSQHTWAHGLYRNYPEALMGQHYRGYDAPPWINTAEGGLGNQAIARRVFNAVANNSNIGCVVVMWSFLSRYDWAMPRHSFLEDTRWAQISPWDTNAGHQDALRAVAGSEPEQQIWRVRRDTFKQTGVGPFADSIYKYAANQYHEIYLSWKSIIWLQHILEKRKIPFMFTLADNTLFYNELKHHMDQDSFMRALFLEIDLTKWFSFGDRMMGFNQWALMNDYPRATTHPLDQAHEDAVKLMLPTFNKLVGGK